MIEPQTNTRWFSWHAPDVFPDWPVFPMVHAGGLARADHELTWRWTACDRRQFCGGASPDLLCRVASDLTCPVHGVG